MLKKHRCRGQIDSSHERKGIDTHLMATHLWYGLEGRGKLSLHHNEELCNNRSDHVKDDAILFLVSINITSIIWYTNTEPEGTQTILFFIARERDNNREGTNRVPSR